ncbi:DsbA family protein [Streptomyces sp. NBC_01264]|uniref:DsbA family protein n=1 Tax=Streptomyces sp. NBC_01264 TaxID=2903804 RepID=UPI002250DE7E|nr:thioredoxin domain-containing protein [Streptomyces sp. NBC_01264]MCX4781512.1 DsbA family protein [Streptomyces sp. NBC_01264]
MQVTYVRTLAYVAVWGALAVAAVSFGPGVLAGLSPDVAPAPAPQAYADTTELPEVLSSDGTKIVVGDPKAKTVVRFYEDPRCPVLADFESTGAKAIRAQTIQGRTRTEYVLASFKDGSLGGDGSKRAVNALRAALDAQKFTEFHAVLMENQAEAEASGGYSTQRLLSLADKVPGLRSEAFDTAVSTMKYSDFVTASLTAYRQTGEDPIGPGTPSVTINTTMLTGELYDDLFDENALTGVLIAVERTPEVLGNRRGYGRSPADRQVGGASADESRT